MHCMLLLPDRVCDACAIPCEHTHTHTHTPASSPPVPTQLTAPPARVWVCGGCNMCPLEQHVHHAHHQARTPHPVRRQAASWVTGDTFLVMCVVYNMCMSPRQTPMHTPQYNRQLQPLATVRLVSPHRTAMPSPGASQLAMCLCPWRQLLPTPQACRGSLAICTVLPHTA
jgi:hypothetical protein